MSTNNSSGHDRNQDIIINKEMKNLSEKIG
jgi:hypothetical protein